MDATALWPSLVGAVLIKSTGSQQLALILHVDRLGTRTRWIVSIVQGKCPEEKGQFRDCSISLPCGIFPLLVPYYMRPPMSAAVGS